MSTKPQRKREQTKSAPPTQEGTIIRQEGTSVLMRMSDGAEKWKAREELMSDLEAIDKIDAASNVVYVYDGETGTCRCGCAGVYTSPAIPVRRSAEHARQSDSLGHVVNQEVANTIVNVFKAHSEAVDVWTGEVDTIFHLEIGQRTYSIAANFPSMRWVDAPKTQSTAK